LRTINLNNLESMDEYQLEDLLEEVKFAVGVHNSCGFVKGMAGVGISITESAVSPHLNGFGVALSAIPEYNDTLDEITLIYGDYIYTNPLMRLGFIVSSTAFQIYRLNNAQSAINNLLVKPVVPSVNSNYRDL
jgi:hypothetical protein